MTVTRDTKNKPSKAKKYLDGFEVWVGKKAGEKAAKCGGPFAWSKIKKGPVTTSCAAAKPKCVCLRRRLLVAARALRTLLLVPCYRASQRNLTPPTPSSFPLRPRGWHRYVTVILPGTRKTLAFGEIEVR